MVTLTMFGAFLEVSESCLPLARNRVADFRTFFNHSTPPPLVLLSYRQACLSSTATDGPFSGQTLFGSRRGSSSVLSSCAKSPSCCSVLSCTVDGQSGRRTSVKTRNAVTADPTDSHSVADGMKDTVMAYIVP